MFYLELTEIDDDDGGIYRQNSSQLTKICLSVIAIDYFWYFQMMFLQMMMIIITLKNNNHVENQWYSQLTSVDCN